jgi:hypothetical protein
MKVGELVRMKLYPEELDAWGVGIVVEHDHNGPLGKWAAVLWVKIGLSWVAVRMLRSLHENR